MRAGGQSGLLLCFAAIVRARRREAGCVRHVERGRRVRPVRHVRHVRRTDAPPADCERSCHNCWARTTGGSFIPLCLPSYLSFGPAITMRR
jgi:hypothetical protein